MNILKSTFLSLVGFLVAVSPALADEAVLQSLLGQVSVKLGATATPVRARPGMKLPRGAEVTTAANSRAVIRFNATDTVRLAPRTTLLVAEVNQNTATSQDTVLRVMVGSVRAMLNRVGKQKKTNFAIAAGGAVCAVKGTEFDMHFPNPGQPPEVVVSQGTVQVGNAGLHLGAVMSALHSMRDGQGGTSVPAGFRVQVNAAGTVSKPSPSPVRTTLEVVSSTGKVMVTVNGVTTEVQPGEEIPSGASVQVVGGEAVLASPGKSVSAGAGSTFTFNATNAGAGGITTIVAVAAGSTPVQVETGGAVATVTAGSTVQTTVTNNAAPTITATTGTISVTTATGTTTTVTEGKTVSTAIAAPTADPTTGQKPATGDPTDLPTTPPPPTLPDMPPDTTNQTNTVISPSAP